MVDGRGGAPAGAQGESDSASAPGESSAPDESPPMPMHEASSAHAHSMHAGDAGGHAGAEASDDATIRHSFEDVERWVKMFDDPARDQWQKPREVIEALGIEPGGSVADIGAGTGYFSPYLARAVGPDGVVYAVDVEPNFVQYLRMRAEREEMANLIPILGSYDNPRLPPKALDVILIVDTYHHIDGRRAYFRSLLRTLKRGGRLVIVDFKKEDAPVGPPLEHKIAAAQVEEELSAAGYRLTSRLSLLPYQYLLIFEPAHQ